MLSATVGRKGTAHLKAKDMSLEYQGLNVVVSGGTGALGSAVVERLLGAGAICHIPCFDPAEAEAFPLADQPNVHLRLSVDLSDESAVTEYYQGLPDLWASIHCAGGFDMSAFESTSLAAYQRMMSMNATTAFLCCREAICKMSDQPGGPAGGRLVNIASRPALEPRAGNGMVPYTMSKAAVAAMTAALGEELASRQIWVNAIAPSIIDTPANRRAMPDADYATWPKVEAIAETVAFLASPRNRTTRSSVVTTYGQG